MATADDKLKAICEQIKKGVAPPKETVRTFLSWFGSARRGYRVVKWIRSTLDSYKLATDPDFEYAYIDGYIAFVHAEGGSASGASVEALSTGAPDPTYRVGRLQPANAAPSTVKPDSTLQQVV